MAGRLLFNAIGKQASTLDELGRTNAQVYDVRGNLVETQYPDGTVTRSVYDALGRAVWSQERALPQTSGTNQTTTTAPARQQLYDAAGRVIASLRWTNVVLLKQPATGVVQPTTPGTPTALSNWSTQFRQSASVTPPTLWSMTVSSTTGGPISLSKTEFDPGGRVTWQMDARGGLTAYGYDSAGQRIAVTNYPGWSRTYTGAYTNLLGVTTYPPTKTVAIVTRWVYDPNGNVAQEIDPLGNTTSYFYDESNRRVATLFPAIGTNAPAATQTVYDSLGRKVQDIDEAGVVTAFGYDALGRLTSVTNDALAAAGVTNLVTTYSYNATGNLITQTDALGRTSLFEYDAFGRRTRRIWPGSTNINDLGTNGLAYPNVEVTTYTNVPSGTSGVSVWERRVRDGRGLTVVADEDVVGRVATVGFPTIYQGAATLRTSRTNRFTYTVAGMIDHVDTVDSSGTLRTTYYKYDDARRRRQADSPEGVLTWQRDAQGNIIAMQGYRRSAVTTNAEVTGGTTTDVDVAYGYDAMNRLSSVTDRKVSTTRSLGYAFDAAGRVQTATYPNGATNRFTYDARHRLLKSIRHGNDVYRGQRIAVNCRDVNDYERLSRRWG